MPNMPQDPRLIALMDMMQKNLLVGRQLPNEMVPGSTVMELLNPRQTFRPPPPMENSAYTKTLPTPPPYGYDRNTRMMGPNTMQGYKNNPPFETDDQGEVVYETPGEKVEDQKYMLQQEGLRRLNAGEVMGMPTLAPMQRVEPGGIPQPTDGPPPLDPTDFPGLEEFLSPGQE